ncbi:MAG: HDIG domain-containing protein [Nitriliruptor sp.]|nr:MAG: HDIG domain-containing protein [Nitriliruptor sp.]
MSSPPQVAAPRRIVLVRLLAAGLIVLLVPAIVALSAVAGDQAVREGEPAPTTILADQAITEIDRAATETERQRAAESAEPVVALDRDAQTEIVADVREVFADARAVRSPVVVEDDPEQSPRIPPRSQQITELQAEQPNLDQVTIEALVALSDSDLDRVESETIPIAQEFARQRVAADEVEALLDEDLPIEIGLRSFPGDTADTIADPVIRTKMRPTVVVDPELTQTERERAAEAVPEVSRTWRPGEAIVREGEIVTALQVQAVERLGLSGTSVIRSVLRTALAMLLVVAVGGIYLGRMQPFVWVSGKKLILLSVLVVAYSGLVVGSTLLTDATSSGWSYAVPAGALGMLTALLIHPVVGIATMLPAAVLVLLVMPASAPVALFAAGAVLISVPLTTRIAKRSDLRSATLRAGLSFPILAAVIVAIFGPREELVVAIGAGAINGVITMVAVQGAMPFLETLFRLPTVTALLDLADRNHPLLRELEEKALGTYNHSVMVASLTERACRAVGADPLIGSVAALYHDIGKVRQPHFFIENQQGIANPHDDLDPEVSAIIIQNHVIDGVEMAVEHRLPPEVVACIGSHHGTMLVTYFYERALADAQDPDEVDEQTYRYKGHKPRSREAAILLLADCCEATTRAMAMSRGNLPRDEIEETVDKLLKIRVDDGQFEESDMTFRDLRTARDTIVESLVGVYHPRIPYPKRAAAQVETTVEDGGPTSPAAEGDGDGPVLPPDVPDLGSVEGTAPLPPRR